MELGKGRVNQPDLQCAEEIGVNPCVILMLRPCLHACSISR